ncbi:hypothetical protein CDAR_483381, partial [Caerostris darwini]
DLAADPEIPETVVAEPDLVLLIRSSIDGLLVNLKRNFTPVDFNRHDLDILALLEEYKSIISENFGLKKREIKHNVTYSIVTKETPVVSKICKLPHDKLKIAKAEFKYMLERSICPPSNSSWSSSLHLMKKLATMKIDVGQDPSLKSTFLPSFTTIALIEK